MKAGLLKDKIVILTSKIKQSGYGENDTEWYAINSVRANVKYVNHDRSNENNEIFFKTTIEFKVRDYVEISEWDRILYKGKQYRILSLLPNSENREIKIITEEVNE